MSTVLNLLLQGEPLSRSQLGQVLNLSDAEIQAEIERLESEKVLLGWRPIFNTEYTQQDCVRAVIEVKISRCQVTQSLSYYTDVVNTL